MHFSKMHALGNDFMVIDAVTQKVYLNPITIRALADRHRGIGFDQLLLIEPPYDPEKDFHYRIFNADGTEVGQCGNGARCFALYIFLFNLTNKKKVFVTTNTRQLDLEILDNHYIKVNMDTPIWTPSKIPFTANKEELTYLIPTTLGTQLCGVVSMGNPHCVVTVNNIEEAPVDSLGYLIEHHQRFPEKTNVPFMEILSPTEVKIRVWERGCGETQACGSGSCGAVAVGIKQGLLSNSQPITVHTLGGDLIIEWDGTDNPLYMTGPASFVYSGTLDTNTIKNIRNDYIQQQELISKFNSLKNSSGNN